MITSSRKLKKKKGKNAKAVPPNLRCILGIIHNGAYSRDGNNNRRQFLFPLLSNKETSVNQVSYQYYRHALPVSVVTAIAIQESTGET